MITRRSFVVALGAAALVPFASFAQQQGKVLRIGFLMENEPSYYTPYVAAFITGMRELGFIEGKDYVIESRTAHTNVDGLPALAAELLALKIDVIISSGTPSAIALRKATSEVPILIVTAGDPVGSKLAASLHRPGGNITGLTGQTSDLTTKRLDLLRQILPAMRRVGILYNPDNISDSLALKQFETDCTKLGLQSILSPLRKREDIVTAFDALRRAKAQGLVVTNAGTNGAWRASIAQQAQKYHLPAIYGRASMVEAGGLISYAADAADLYRRVAAYAVKIFKGAKPGDLPIEQPLKFEMAINLQTAKALGLKIPDVILLRADKVIE